MGDLRWVSTSQLQPSPVSPISSFWEVKQQMKVLSLIHLFIHSLSLSFSNYKYIYIYIYLLPRDRAFDFYVFVYILSKRKVVVKWTDGRFWRRENKLALGLGKEMPLKVTLQSGPHERRKACVAGLLIWECKLSDGRSFVSCSLLFS